MAGSRASRVAVSATGKGATRLAALREVGAMGSVGPWLKAESVHEPMEKALYAGEFTVSPLTRA